MLITVWALGLLLLVLWSAAMWAAHVGWTMLAALPWSQAVEAALATGYVTGEQFDQWVRPQDMVGPR